MNSNLRNSDQENNYYFLSHNGEMILVGSDHKPEFEIPFGDFEQYLLLIDRIGTHIYPEWDEQTTITMDDFLTNDQDEIDQHLTEYIKNGGSKQEPDLTEIPLPVSDTYELVSAGQRATYFEERYLKYIL